MNIMKKTKAIVSIIVFLIGAGIVPSIADIDTETVNYSDEGFYQPADYNFLNQFKSFPGSLETQADNTNDGLNILGQMSTIGNDQSSVQKKWTWLFYDDADFYRAYDPLEDFSDEAYSNENLDVLVLQDKEYGPAKMWYVDENHNTELLENMGEINMGDHQTLQDFVSYTKDNYPADRYILSMYNHGGGWRGACSDDTDNDWLTMNEIQQALTETGGVDIICFTAPCLMGALESAYELRDCVDVYIGSEELSGYGHWHGTIENMCNTLNDNPNISTNKYGEIIIQSVWENTPWPDSITMSAIDTGNMESLVSALDAVASSFITQYDNDTYNLFWTIYPTIQSLGNGFCIDTYDFAFKCSNGDFDQKIIQDLNIVIDSYSEVIINECHGDYPGANGLTIYIPDFSNYSYDSQYGSSSYGLDFAENTQWDEFISLYCTEQIEPGVDQYQTEATSGSVSCSKFIWSQSFIPTKDSLKKVELKLLRRGSIKSDIKVSIRKTLNGEDLTTVAIPYNRVISSFDWISFNFPDITVVSGETYYLLLSTEGGDNSDNYYLWGINYDPDSYSNGEGWLGYPGSTSWSVWDPPFDFCFKTFFIESLLDPPIIDGATSGETGIQYEYTFIADDPNDLEVYYYIDWGDGTMLEWKGPYQSGEEISFTHTWDSKGSFIIKAKAKNTENEETDWTTLEINMPKTKAINHPFLNLMENFLQEYQYLYLIFKHIFSII